VVVVVVVVPDDDAPSELPEPSGFGFLGFRGMTDQCFAKRLACLHSTGEEEFT
jgi:hypothetical protein